MEPSEVLSTTPSQPVPAEPLRWLETDSLPRPDELDDISRIDYIGRLRLPIAGPYHPWARLYRLPDRRLVWVVRLWEGDRAVRRVTSTSTLLEFARLNRLPAVAGRVRSLDRRGRGAA